MRSAGIGEMNGIWQLLFKLAILAIPLVAALEVWQVNMIYELRQTVNLDNYRLEIVEQHIRNMEYK